MNPKELQKRIERNNQSTKETYPSGKNHKGTKLKYHTVQGYKVWAINEEHATNIFMQTKMGF